MSELGTRSWLVALALAVASCSAASTGHPEPSSAVATGASPSSSIPFDQPSSTAETLDSIAELSRFQLSAAVGYTQSELNLVDSAWQVLFNECLAGLGLPPAEFPPTRDLAADAARELSQLRFDDLEKVQSSGYRWLLPSPDAASEASNEELNPVDQDQCKTAANSEVGNGAPVGGATAPIIEAQAEISARARSAEELEGVKALWTECMDAAGYPDLRFDDPAWFIALIETPEPTTEEIRIATADYDCRISTGFTNARLEFLAREVQRWLAENENTVLAVREQIAAEVENAKRILES